MSATDEPGDIVHIEQLDVAARIGVPDEERDQPQRLTVSITMWPRLSFDEMENRLERTVDYATVGRDVKEFIGSRSDKLIETLAAAIASRLLESFPIRKVRLELRKFILPDVNHVSVTLVRERTSEA